MRTIVHRMRLLSIANKIRDEIVEEKLIHKDILHISDDKVVETAYVAKLYLDIESLIVAMEIMNLHEKEDNNE
tara:strand:- start:187 stop:405 length:219 start_codon:yes stop_codon:yes gene_type:complete